MTNVTFPRKEIEKHVKLTPENIDKISLFGTPLERIDKDEVEIEVFPNRPDLISMQGWLRGFKAFLGKEKGLKRYNIGKPKPDYKVKILPSVKNVRPFTACAIVSGLDFDDEKIKEIIDLQEKLHITVGRNRKKVAIGIYPLEKITLPIKYEARYPDKIRFVPLEESREMSGNQILSRTATGRDYAHLLEEYEKYPIFVDAKGKILSMPPIINSHDTGKVTHKTKEVFIECSGWHFETLKKTLNIVVTTLADMGGKVHAMELDYGKKIVTPDLAPERMGISVENVNKLLGLKLKESDLEKLLPKMGLDYKNRKVIIPGWRTDVLHEVDLIEDVAIAYGYDKLVPEIPNVATIAEESEESKFVNKLRDVLIGLGLTEIQTYHLIKSGEARGDLLEVEDSKTDYKFLRPNLLIPALRILSENKDNEYPQRIFEVGAVFSRDVREESGVAEKENLIVACAPANFTEMKQVLDYLMKSFGVKYSVIEGEEDGLIDGRVGRIKVEGEDIGYLGEVHPETLKDWGMKMGVGVLEVGIEKLT